MKTWNPCKAEYAFRWGLVFTTPYLAFLSWVTWLKWEEIPYLAANEIGDTLAGAFGPVAFLWLILGYIQQQAELKINTQSLQLQVKELKESVKQQEALAEANQEMIKLELKKSFVISQPIFKQVESSYRVLKSKDNLVLKFVNHGHPITNLKVNFEEPSSLFDFYSNSFVDRNETFEIEIMHSKISVGTKLNFEFKDGLLDRQIKKYTFIVLSKDEDEHFNCVLI